MRTFSKTGPIFPLILGIFVGSSLVHGASEVEAKPRQNFLQNPGFEAVRGQEAAGWQIYGAGYRIDRGAAHSGTVSICCESTEPDAAFGAMQEVVFSPPIRHPFRVSGWSRAKGAAGLDYCLYMDCWYADGTNLWGQRRNFTGGTHGWEKVDFVFEAAKPIRKIQYFILFRKAVGKVWFDDVSLSLAPFEIQHEKILSNLFGPNDIEYFARLSLPGRWAAWIEQNGRAVFRRAGRDRIVRLQWDGRNETGKLLPAGRYQLCLDATDDFVGEPLRIRHRVVTRNSLKTGYVVWTESSMKRVLVDAFPPRMPPPHSARIALARNEDESFQIVLRPAPGRRLRNCTVHLSALRDDRGHVLPASNIDWKLVGFVFLAKLHPHPFMQDAVPGWWPDPLLPAPRFSVPPGSAQALWITVHAGPNQAPGIYRGTVRVQPENLPAASVPLSVRVYDFRLPVQPHIKTAFALMDGFLRKIYGHVSRELRRKYGDFLLRHHLNPDDISRYRPPDIDDIAYYDRRGLNAFNVLNMVAVTGHPIWVCYSPKSAYTPAFKRKLIATLDPYVAELRRRGLDRKAYIYTFDERGRDFWPIIREYFGLVKNRYRLPTLTTAKIPLDPKIMKRLHVDWICPLTPSYDFRKAEKCRRAGLEVWAYICLGPRSPYANWLADDPLIEARLIWWQAYHQQMDGFLYWGLNIWSRAHNDHPIDPEKDGPRLKWSITTGGRYDRLHGDGELLYPGAGGPIGSIRLANIRDGIDDYEYLWLLARKEGVAAARRACLPVTQNLTTFTHDPAVLLAQRRRIAREISGAPPGPANSAAAARKPAGSGNE